jgi:hypothetical protein
MVRQLLAQRLRSELGFRLILVPLAIVSVIAELGSEVADLASLLVARKVFMCKQLGVCALPGLSIQLSIIISEFFYYKIAISTHCLTLSFTKLFVSRRLSKIARFCCWRLQFWGDKYDYQHVQPPLGPSTAVAGYGESSDASLTGTNVAAPARTHISSASASSPPDKWSESTRGIEVVLEELHRYHRQRALCKRVGRDLAAGAGRRGEDEDCDGRSRNRSILEMR